MTIIKKTLAMTMLIAAVVGCCCQCCKDSAEAVSPDGRNVIKVTFSPLAYEIIRDGKQIISKTAIGMKVNGMCLAEKCSVAKVSKRKLSGEVKANVYKKAKVNLAANETLADFGNWALRIVARNDGVAYRFETKMPGEITVNCEKADFTIADSNAVAYINNNFGGFKDGDKPRDTLQNSWERITRKSSLSDLFPLETVSETEKMQNIAYLPLLVKYSDGTALCITESDLIDYPGWNIQKPKEGENTTAASIFAKWPKMSEYYEWGVPRSKTKRLRSLKVIEREDYLVKTKGTRTFPWRSFLIEDSEANLVANDLVWALATPSKVGDESWIKPGKVAWDWWNDWNLEGVPFKAGCNTKSYEYYIDFAAKTGVEYVIFDEGWSEKLNIWKYHPNVDVDHLIKYANNKGVGIILWMAWAQIVDDEARVVDHFAKLGVKGFKVDFMDRDDASCVNSLWKFADHCAKAKLIVDYHGMFKPTGIERTYPNIVNFEGVHGLEQMKWYRNAYDIMYNDLCCYFVRMSAGPMDYTPGAMDNYQIGKYKGTNHNPGSVGTRCRQMAMMSMFFAPLQMLCDSPTKYEKNMECFDFMSKTPVVWDDTVGLPGNADGYAACARRSGDVWYAAGMSNSEARDYEFDTAFLGEGNWNAEIFRDAPDADKDPTKYIHETKAIKAGEKFALKMAPGGGFVVRFTK